MGGCTTSKSGGDRIKVYIEHTTEQQCLDAFKIASQSIQGQMKIQVSQQLKPNQNNIFNVFVINPRQNRQSVWSLSAGDQIITQDNVQNLIDKIKSVSLN